MTIEEALELARQTEKCFITWRADTGEIIQVKPAGGDRAFVDRLDEMKAASKAPVLGRFFPSATLTAAILHEPAAVLAETRRRGTLYRSWGGLLPDQIVSLLERHGYASPLVDQDRAVSYLSMILWQIHGANVTPELRGRLRNLTRADHFAPRSTLELRIWLAAGESDVVGLKAIWRHDFGGHRLAYDGSALFDAFAYVRPADPEVIDELIGTVETPFMFGPRWRATIALGQIGPAAGPRAVDVIRKHIWDSSPYVSQLRDTVIRRITDPEDAWVPCSRCHRGHTLYDPGPDGIPWVAGCPACREMGVIPREAGPADLTRPSSSAPPS